jgi:hypothetical protein
MNPPVHPTSLCLVGNWQLLVAFPFAWPDGPPCLSGLTPVGIPARAPRFLDHRRSLARRPHSRWSLARTSFRQLLAPPRFVTISDNTRWYSGKWRNGLGLWIGNGGLVMRELRARLCLSCFLFVFGSVDFFLVLLPCFVLVMLVFGFAVVRLVSDERALCISGVEKFWPTPLYKASMYIVWAFFFTQQFTLLYKNTFASSRS